jgi:hypothetical protein
MRAGAELRLNLNMETLRDAPDFGPTAVNAARNLYPQVVAQIKILKTLIAYVNGEFEGMTDNSVLS